MTLSFHDEMLSYLKHKLEQDPGIHRLTTGQTAGLTPQDVLDSATRMIGHHNGAFLMVAEEIDKLRAAADSG